MAGERSPEPRRTHGNVQTRRLARIVPLSVIWSAVRRVLLEQKGDQNRVLCALGGAALDNQSFVLTRSTLNSCPPPLVS